MKCPNCGYDKIQPNFIFCPNCKAALPKEQPSTNQFTKLDETTYKSVDGDFQEKGFINRAFSRWTYEKAKAEPYAYAIWADKNPNDNKVFLGQWYKEGHDLSVIQDAIKEAHRARHENPTTDSTEVHANIINSTQESSRHESNNSFVQAVNADYTTDAAALVRNKAIWKLQPGELARHIAPDEWCYVSEHLGGIVIEEGTSAIIYVDGEEVAKMGSGMYVFDDKHKITAELDADRRKHENQGFFSRLADGIYRVITGHRREENTQQREERRRRVQQIIGRLKKDTTIDVYLKSDRVFPAIFGQQYSSDSSDGYQPYNNNVIQSRYLDLKVGVSMHLQIGDFKDFITNYLDSRKSVTINDIVKAADPSVFSLLKYHFRDIEITERGLDKVTFNALKEHLKSNLPNLLHGIIVVDVLDITTSNEQLERFRKVEGQLYCSEQEYDFLLRTNEFRNRIASEENDQKIREARSEQDLRRSLDEVNKDKLLHDDEMEQFVSLLMNQKAVREAKNKSDLYRALLKISENDLIAKEEFEIFSTDLENRRFERDQVSEQLRIRSLVATALTKMDANKTLELREIEDDKTIKIAGIRAEDEVSDEEWAVYCKGRAHDAEDWEMEAIIYGRKYVLERQKLVDEAEKRRLQNAIKAEEIKGAEQQGAFERGKKLAEHELEEKLKDDEYRRQILKEYDAFQLEVQKKEERLKELHRLMEIEQEGKDRDALRALQAQQQQSQRELDKIKEENQKLIKQAEIAAEIEKARISAESTMTANQLVAKNITGMDPVAQAKFAESFSHLKETELVKQNAEEREKMFQQLLNMAQAHNVNMSGVQTANANQQMEIIKLLLSTFGQMNGAQNAGQQNLVGSLIGAMQSFATTRFNDVNFSKEEYRQQMQHEQGRADEAQKQALNYTTHVKVSENAPNNVRGTSVNVNVNSRTCPSCKKHIDDDNVPFCPYCGNNL